MKGCVRDMGTSESADKGNVRGTAWRRMIGSALVLALCTLALYALHRQLRIYHLQDIRRALASIPSAGLCLAGLFKVLGYAAMTGYDALALRYGRRWIVRLDSRLRVCFLFRCLTSLALC